MAVKFTNNASTTLTASVAVDDTSIAVASVSGFPDISSSGYYYVTIDSEVLKVTAASGTTLTIDAAVSSHTSAAGVELRVAAEVLEDIRTETTYTATGLVAVSASNVISTTANNYTHPNHSGDVVSAADGAMTIQVDAVDIAMLSASGTASSSTYLRGDNSWQAISTDPTMGGDLSGSASNAQIVSNTVGASEINVSGNGTSGQLLTSDGDGTMSWTTAGGGGVESGTVMVFHQAAAPTDWTQVTTQNNKALRVVSGSGGGAGGTHDLTAPPSTSHSHSFSDSSSTTSNSGSHSHTGPSHTHSTPNHSHSHNLSAGSHTLSNAQMPSHGHYSAVGNSGGYDYGANIYSASISNNGRAGRFNTSNSGSSSSHSHNLSGSINNSGASNTGSGGTGNTSNTGSHSHTVAVSGTSGSAGATQFKPKYIDVIICSKD